MTFLITLGIGLLLITLLCMGINAVYAWGPTAWFATKAFILLPLGITAIVFGRWPNLILALIAFILSAAVINLVILA